MRSTRALLAAGIGVFALSPMTAQAGYSALYAFGDSLSDAGNIFLSTSRAIPGPPYFAGRFSNGPVTLDIISTSLGFGAAVPSILGGNDFAFGGARTGFAGIPGTSSTIPNVQVQAGLFAAANHNVAPSGALYFMWIGGNDIRDLTANGLVPGTLTLAQAQTAARGAAAVEAGVIQGLAAAGARHFLVPLLGDVGKTPESLAGGPAVSAGATNITLAYNAALQAGVATFAGGLGLDVTFVDTNTLLDNIAANPAQYGFTDATDPCYVGPLTGGGTVCANPSRFVFWDTIHPSTAADAQTAALALNDLPEPGTLAVLGGAAAGLLAARRRTGVRNNSARLCRPPAPGSWAGLAADRGRFAAGA